jgi:hypothetical protein
MHAKLSFDPQRDLAPITQLSAFPNVLVANVGFPAKSVQDLVAHAKARPGQVAYSSAGSGTGTHLSAELFKNLTGVDLLHVPYKGGGPLAQDAIAGHVPIAIGSVALLAPSTAQPLMCHVDESMCRGGVLFDNECWHLSRDGESCAKVCGNAATVNEPRTRAGAAQAREPPRGSRRPRRYHHAVSVCMLEMAGLSVTSAS